MNYVKKNSLRLIVGLGNPLEQYAHTYHNIGMRALDYIHNHLPDGWTLSETKHPKKSFVCEILTAPDKTRIVLMRPQVFMNESGSAVHDALSFFHIPLSQILVIHDDSDMIIGSYKLSHDQRSAGHRGIESIIAQCGSQTFFRAKIGIRPTEETRRKKADEFVLKKISKKDGEVFEHEVFPSLVSRIFD